MAVAKGSLSQMLNAFEDKLEDLEGNDIESSFDYPDDLEDLENGEYESHMTEPVNASVPTKPEFDILEKSTIEASDEDEFNSWLWEFENSLESEIIGRHSCVDYVEFDEVDGVLSMTVAFYSPDGEFNLNDYDIPVDDLTQDDELLSDDVDMVADIVDIDLDEFDVDDE